MGLYRALTHPTRLGWIKAERSITGETCPLAEHTGARCTMFAAALLTSWRWPANCDMDVPCRTGLLWLWEGWASKDTPPPGKDCGVPADRKKPWCMLPAAPLSTTLAPCGARGGREGGTETAQLVANWSVEEGVTMEVLLAWAGTK